MNETENFYLRAIIVRPGQTELDEQGRIAGSLDVPLSTAGVAQIDQLAMEFASIPIDRIYSGPSTASRETASILAQPKQIKIKVEEDLRNLDCGLWHGKRIEELKVNQPRLFKMWQEHPQSVYPPNGENIDETKNRVARFTKKLVKKQKPETVIIVAAEPVACILRSLLEAVELSKYWTVNANCGTWVEVIKDLHTIGI